MRIEMTEKQLQESVTHFARLHGWMVCHTRFSVGSDRGWPDLFLVREDRAVAVELKAARSEERGASLLRSRSNG